MTRPKTQTDKQVLDSALAIVRRSGVSGLTFSSLASRTGLSAPTLVQRFSNKPTLTRRTLLHAWDDLYARTRDLAAATPLTSEGAVELLLELSRSYAGTGSFGDGLLLLREDVRDAELRARGAAWETQLVEALNARLTTTSDGRIGYALAAFWQGTVIWWSYQPEVQLESYLGDRLRSFLHLMGR